jgi:hypothetical protein
MNTTSGPSVSPSSAAIASASSHESNGWISPARRLRVLDQRRHVLLDPLPPHRSLQHLAQRAMRPVTLALRQRRAPGPDLIGPQRSDRLITERIQRRSEVLAQPRVDRKPHETLLQSPALPICTARVRGS